MGALRTFVILAIAAGLASCALRPSPPSANPGTWQTEAPMLHARAAHAVVSTSTAIYALGGTGRGYAPVLPVERFDGNAWSVETSLPGPGLNAPAAAAIDGKIYVIGGFNTTTNIPSEQVYVYDTRSRNWSIAASLPAPRGGHAAIVMDGKIHVLGGGNSQSTLADHDVFDPATNRWSRLAPLPRSEGSPAAVVFMGKLYAIGGRSGPADFGAVDIYDPATDTWSAGPAIPPRGTSGAAVYCNAIYLVGGESQARVETLADVLRLDAHSGQWQAQAPLPTARNFARAVILHGAMYVVGGNLKVGPSHASAGSSVVESFRADCTP